MNSENQEIIKFLSHCKKRYRDSILKNCDRQLAQCLCECVYNLLHGNIPLDKKSQENLHKYRYQMRHLCSKSKLKQKKKILVQHGGFLKFLLPLVLASISNEIR